MKREAQRRFGNESKRKTSKMRTKIKMALTGLERCHTEGRKDMRRN
jgi:hypothetical protein